MKTLKPLLLIIGTFYYLVTTAQLQWYQNQDAQSPGTYGTIGTSIKSFTTHTFIACYLWNINGEVNTWKISKSNISGTELGTFFVSSVSSNVEFKISSGCIFVFERGFTSDYTPQYRLFKLDANLTVKSQKTIELPNGFFIYNTNAFELDNAANVYLAGDGQYPDNGGGYLPASFVWKMDKNLETKWRRVDSIRTSYNKLYVTSQGKIMVIADHYDFFPEVKITKLSSSGQYIGMKTVSTDPTRYSLYSVMDKSDDLYLYGGKSIGDTAQALYVMKIDGFANQTVVYNKTLFPSSGTQLNDLQIDGQGRMFTLVTQYFGPDNQVCKVSRIKPGNGCIYWSRSMQFSNDSCNLAKLVIDNGDRFYAVGERRSCNYFSKGFAIRLKKFDGNMDADYPAPDSVAFQRSHWLADGIIDHNNQLIAIGNTSDLDTISLSNTYCRAFTARFDYSGRTSKGGEEENVTMEKEFDEDFTARMTEPTTAVIIYPNPAHTELMVKNINPEKFNQVSIYSLNGVRIQQMHVTGVSVTINVRNLSNGIYLAVLHSTVTSDNKTLKFVVER